MSRRNLTQLTSSTIADRENTSTQNAEPDVVYRKRKVRAHHRVSIRAACADHPPPPGKKPGGGSSATSVTKADAPRGTAVGTLCGLGVTPHWYVQAAHLAHTHLRAFLAAGHRVSRWSHLADRRRRLPTHWPIGSLKMVKIRRATPFVNIPSLRHRCR
jgi:hypothetical protein